MDGIRDRDWRSLIWGIRQGSCILFLGNDVPIDIAAGGTSSLHRELAGYLKEGLEDGDVDTDSLRDIAYLYQLEHGRSDLQAEVDDFLAGCGHLESAPVAGLARLPWRTVVTASFDDIFERALKAAGKKPLVDHYNFRGDMKEIIDSGSADAPLVYHLYGDRSDPDSLILTENDLLDFLVAVISKSPALPNNLRSELIGSGVSFLFVGFGLRHPYLRVLLHVLRMQDVDSRSFALEGDAALPSGAGDGMTPILFRKGYKIQLLEQDLAGFCSELVERFESSDTGSETASADDAPAATEHPAKIFLSYASENEKPAAWIVESLEKANFEVWFDKSELKGGDAWDRLIESQVNGCDYFLLVQSEALADKQFSYVNKEIHLALDRQKFARAGVRFIIPLSIDKSPPLQELESLQSMPIETDDHIHGLIQLLRRDQQRRKRRA